MMPVAKESQVTVTKEMRMKKRKKPIGTSSRKRPSEVTS